MILFCKYGSDASDPEAGFVFAHHDDDKVPPAGSYSGCLALPYTGQIEALGKFGPEPVSQRPDGKVYDFRPFLAPRLTLAVALSAKLAELSDACGALIAGGFVSSALNPGNVYPSSDEDQRNLTAAAGAAIMGQSKAGWSASLKCGPLGQKATRQAHTAGQVHAVLADWMAFKEGLTSKLDGLKAKALAATKTADVAAVTWG